MSGIALMLDAVIAAVDAGRKEEATRVLSSALEMQRATIRSLRDLSFELEPVVLRDQGFGPAVRALADQLGMQNSIQIELEVEPAETLTEHAQVAIFQIIREAFHQAIRRGPPTRVWVRIAEAGDGVEAVVADNAPGERRRAGFDAIEERARSLSGQMTVDPGPDGGTAVRIVFPPYESGDKLAALMAAEPSHCLFVSKPTGYELVEREGEPPPVGSIVELDGQGRWVVNRIGQSPLPQDRRPCAYLLPTTS